MIKVSVDNGTGAFNDSEALYLDNVQNIMVEGKCRYVMHDYAGLLLQNYGFKLSKLKIEGFYHFSEAFEKGEDGLSKLDKLITFFRRDTTIFRDRYLITLEDINADIMSGVEVPTYRGVIDSVGTAMDVEKANMLISYVLNFLVYPVPDHIEDTGEMYFYR